MSQYEGSAGLHSQKCLEFLLDNVCELFLVRLFTEGNLKKDDWKMQISYM